MPFIDLDRRGFPIDGSGNLAPPNGIGLSPDAEAAFQVIQPNLSAIGCIQIYDSTGNTPIVPHSFGTCFLTTDNVLITNRHVLAGKKGGTKFAVPKGNWLWELKDDYRYRVSFNRTPGNMEDSGFLLPSSFVAPPKTGPNRKIDIAVIRPEAGSPLPSARLTLGTNDDVPKDIALVGHPYVDWSSSKTSQQEKDAYAANFPGGEDAEQRGSKRIGFINIDHYRDPPRNRIFVHDAAAEPGSSGGPILDTKDGTVVGIHYRKMGANKNAFTARVVNSVVDLALPKLPA